MLLVYCLQTQIVQLKELRQMIFMKTIGYPEDSKFLICIELELMMIKDIY